MASLYRRKDSPYFWIKYRNKNGWIIQESTRCRPNVAVEVRQARALAAEKTAIEFRAQARHTSGWAWVLDFLQERYRGSPITFEHNRTVWLTLEMFLAERNIEHPAHLTRQHCFDYIAWRRTHNKSKGKFRACHNTAVKELGTLRVVMQEAVERELVTGNPCMKLRIRKDASKQKAEMTAVDCELIRAEIQKVKDGTQRQMLALSFEIARHQGCRLAETKLDPMTAVDLSTNTIRFRAKGGRDLVTLLHPKLAPLFRQLQAEGRRTTWEQPAGTKRTWASAQWFRFLNKIGLRAKGITFHSTRVTVVTEMARANIPEGKAKSYVGHSSTLVHRIYQRLRPSDLSNCADAIG